MRTLIALLLAAPLLHAAAPTPANGWRIDAKESRVEQYRGREALFLRGGEAWMDAARFRDGVIELDVAAPADPGFHGIAFRAQDKGNYEEVYLRSHLSKQPDATQYTPVFNDLWGWQIYSTPRFSQPLEIVADRWVHVRLAVRGQRAELTVDGQTVVFPELIRSPAEGFVGITSAAGPAWFANVEIRPGDPGRAEGGEGAPRSEVPANIVKRWRVSEVFAESPVQPEPKDWQPLDSGERGIANLAMIRTRTDKQNTVIAATTLRAQKAGPLRVKFGFSDRVVVYLNGRPIFRGNERFQSRDPRFLGTIGLFHELVLPLKAGANEVWFAVSEDFGGWGVTMQLVDAPGVTID